jgi:hypothetical protein
MVAIGWQDYVLQVEYKGGARYQYGGVPKEVHDKILRVPYPDSLWNQLRAKGMYVGKRVDAPPVAKPQPTTIDIGNLPF